MTDIEKAQFGDSIEFSFAPEISFSPERIRYGQIILSGGILVLHYGFEGIILKPANFSSFKIVQL